MISLILALFLQGGPLADLGGWETLESLTRPITVRYQAGDRAFARDVLRAAEVFTPLGVLRPSEPLTIVLASSQEKLRALAPPHLPEWGRAYALPDEATIVVPSPRALGRWGNETILTLRHELVHLLLAQSLPGTPIPRWFHEGMASFLAGEGTEGSLLPLSLALMADRLIPLDELVGGFPQEAERARLAYLESRAAVELFHRLGGRAGLVYLLENWRDEGELDAALRRTYGLTYKQFVDRWKEFLWRRYGWASLLSEAAVLWGGVTLLFVFLYLRRRRAYRERLAAMCTQEAIEDAVRDVESLGRYGT